MAGINRVDSGIRVFLVLSIAISLLSILPCNRAPAKSSIHYIKREPPKHSYSIQQDTVPSNTDDTLIHQEADSPPKYPGGERRMKSDLSDNLVEESGYETIARQINGEVNINFVIEKNGQVDQVSVSQGQGLEGDITRDAVDAIKKLRKFHPALVNGKPVRFRYSIPITFTHKEIREEKTQGNIFSGG